MIEVRREIVSAGEIADKIAKLTPSGSRENPVGSQIWDEPEKGFSMALKSNGNGSGLYRLIVEGDPNMRDLITSDFQRFLGDPRNLIRLPSSPRVVVAFWNATQVTQRLNSYFSDTL